MRQKRPFVLLEVVIALGLLMLLIFPLLESPVLLYREGAFAFQESEGERLADWTFTEIREALLRHEIPWEKLPAFDEEKGPFILRPKEIRTASGKTQDIQRTYTLACWKKMEKVAEGGRITRLLEVGISFDPPLRRKNNKPDKRAYRYRILVEKRPQPA